MGEARDRIDDEQHRLAAVAEILGDGGRRLRRQAPHHRAFVAGGDDRDGARAVFRERPFQELAHLAAALADERHHDGVEAAGAGQHGKQRRLADAGAGEDADALAGAERREQIDDADAGLERLLDALARHRRRRRASIRHRAARRAGAARAVDRLAERVDDAAFPGRRRD